MLFDLYSLLIVAKITVAIVGVMTLLDAEATSLRRKA